MRADITSNSDLDEINKFRKQMGLNPLVRKTRYCIKPGCARKFESFQSNHRMCMQCRFSLERSGIKS